MEGFGAQFIRWARQNYGAVLAFDHWTLSKTPEDNARLLIEELRTLDPALLRNGALDVICHSRGGLVARSLCELLGHGAAVRNLIFIGTPNCGTDLANPRNWGTFADLLVNVTGVSGAELLGRLAGLLAQLAVRGVMSDVPGLLAQNPESLNDARSFLSRLQRAKVDRSRLRYGIVCAEFEPTALVPNLKKMLHTAAQTGIDALADELFGAANDLVVNTAHTWGIARSGDELARLPDFVSPGRVLVFRPPDSTFKPPAQVQIESALGMHHSNLFAQPRVQASIQAWLTEP